MAADIIPILGAGAFGLFFVFVLLISLVEIVGKIYATYRSLVRDDLTGEQRIIYLVLVWFVPFGWIIYFLLGTEKTSELFSEVDFL